jgi:hypothetical protein
MSLLLNESAVITSMRSNQFDAWMDWASPPHHGKSSTHWAISLNFPVRGFAVGPQEPT